MFSGTTPFTLKMNNMSLKLIAELCQNHNGNEKVLFEMLEAAASHGASHVKVQHIFAENVTYRSAFEKGVKDDVSGVSCFKRPYKEEVKRLKKLEIPNKTVKKFIKEARRLNVIPLSTCFASQHIRELKELGFEEIKIASYDCASFSMLKKISSHFNKIYVSTGATFDSEIKEASKILGNKASFLHCVTRYPTPINNLNLSRIKFLKKFSKEVGYSDHSETEINGNLASFAAIYNGASIIERHFTILGKEETKDGKVSINSAQLEELNQFHGLNRKKQLNILEGLGYKKDKFLGKGKFKMSKEEYQNRLYYRGRFASLVSENGIKRHIYNWE